MIRSKLRRWVSLLVAVVLLAQCAPLTALAAITVDNSGSFRLIQPDKAVYVTYEFYNGSTKVDSQIVNHSAGEKPTLVPPTPSVGEGQEFIGWYIGNSQYRPNAVNGEYSASTTVRVEARFSDIYYVYFMDVNKSYVHATGKATSANGYKVSLPKN